MPHVCKWSELVLRKVVDCMFTCNVAIFIDSEYLSFHSHLLYSLESLFSPSSSVQCPIQSLSWISLYYFPLLALAQSNSIYSKLTHWILLYLSIYPLSSAYPGTGHSDRLGKEFQTSFSPDTLSSSSMGTPRCSQAREDINPSKL